MPKDAHITSVRFKGFKAFMQYSLGRWGASLANRELGKAEMGTVRRGFANSPFARGGGLLVTETGGMKKWLPEKHHKQDISYATKASI